MTDIRVPQPTNLPPGVDSIGDGFDGSSTTETTDDGKVSSVTPQLPLPDNATETEKDVAKKIEEENK